MYNKNATVARYFHNVDVSEARGIVDPGEHDVNCMQQTATSGE